MGDHSGALRPRQRNATLSPIVVPNPRRTAGADRDIRCPPDRSSDTPGTGKWPCHSSSPDLVPNAQASMAPVKASPPAVMTTPLTSGVPGRRCRRARSSVVPTRERQRILLAFRSTERRERDRARHRERGALRSEIWPGGGALRSARGINLTMHGAAGVGVEDLADWIESRPTPVHCLLLIGNSSVPPRRGRRRPLVACI
jgi:hypothetical protein